MSNNIGKYDKLITAVLVIVAFVLGIGWWFAGEKSEPVYLSKIDKLMFDKDNKAPTFVLTLPDDLTVKEKTKTEEVVVDAVKPTPQVPEVKEKVFSLEELIKTVPLLQNLPNKTPTQVLDLVENDEDLSEKSADNKLLPKISEDGRKPWIAYGKAVKIQPNFKKIAVVISNLGLDFQATDKIATAFNSEISMSFTPYLAQPEASLRKARTNGHETYVDLLLSSKDFLKEDSGPLSIIAGISPEETKKRFYKALAQPLPIGGLIIRDGKADESNKPQLTTLLKEAKDRGLLVVDASSGDGIAKIEIEGLARRRADIVINKDMVKSDIEKLLKKAENIAFDKGQVLIVTDTKPVALTKLYEWINTFSPQVSYEEAKTVDISKPFALVPVSNLVVE